MFGFGHHRQHCADSAYSTDYRLLFKGRLCNLLWSRIPAMP